MDADLFLQQFGHLAQGEGGIKKLRDVILQLAVQGKLIAQSQANEPAQTLLKRINPKATKLDGLYEIPSNWVWTKLGCVSSYIQRGKGPTYSDIKQVPVVSQKCVQWRGFDFALARFIDPKTLQNYQEERFLVAGDLLWNSTGTGTLGRVCIYPGSQLYSKVVADSHVKIVRLNSIEPRYVWCFLASPIVQMNIEASGSTNQIELSTSTVKNHPVPIPPLAEQKRIVAKVDELMALCDKLEAEQTHQRTLKTQAVQSTLHHLRQAENPASFSTSLNILKRTFGNWFDDLATVKHLRATILQLAVQGKLVPQNPTDEPASELLKRIEAEKKRLVKEGKIKAPKTSVKLQKSEIPYTLPASWVWSNLSQLGQVNPRNNVGDDLEAGFIPMPLISSDYGKIPSFQTKKWGDIKSGFTHFAENDVGLAKITPCFQNSKAAIFRCLPNGIGAGTTELHVFRDITQSLFCDYVYLFIKTPQFLSDGEKVMTGSAGQKRVPSEYFAFTSFPLPPLAEQKRIVAKVDELMTLCDQLEAHITHTQTLNTHLMDSLIHRMTEAA